MIDLHNHTTASDGALSPTALIERAFEHGITGIAVTDHDTLAGLDEAAQTGRRLGVEVYGGIEISATLDGGRSLHILGYGFDREAKELGLAIQKLQNARKGRNIKICEKLTALGMPVAIEEVDALAETTVGRPHFAQVMVNKGYVETAKEAFDRWLGNACPAFIDKEVLTPKQTIQAIQNAGGLAVLAHPLIYVQEAKRLEKFLAGLASLGLDGMEVYYGSYTAGQITMLRCFADRYDLLAGGGSDFHEDPHPLGPGFPDDIAQKWKTYLRNECLACA